VPQATAEVVMMTPERARKLLKHNKINRRLREYHVRRISALMLGGRWRFNGDTIRLDTEGNLLDGQHRLNAIVNTGITIPVVLVCGVERDAMPTIDTAKLQRSYGDVIQIKGGASDRYQQQVGTALVWLCRYDRGVIPKMNLPENRIEADEVATKFANCPKIQDAVERCLAVKNVGSPAMLGCVYYILTRANRFELAERMVDTMLDPSLASTTDPFFLLRQWFLNQTKGSKRRNPVDTFAYIFKACNYAFHGHQPKALVYKPDGARSEPYPALEADTYQKG
jgi:hypothetical protein